MTPNQLYGIREFSDVFVDSALRDRHGELVFLSLYGRDTAVLQFLASFSLPSSQGGRRDFTLVRGSEQYLIDLPEPEKLQKQTGRFPRANLFGNLTHTWLYREDAIKPDKANRSALLLRYDETQAQFEDRCWRVVVELSSVPLLEHWRSPLMSALAGELVLPLMDTDKPPIGMVDGAHVTVGDSFEMCISVATAMGALTLDPDAVPGNAAQLVREAATVAKRSVSSMSHASTPLFELGQVVCTAGIEELIVQGWVSPTLLLHRHQCGDWGITNAEDSQANDRAVKEGRRILSAYPIDPSQASAGYGANTVWIITERDRSVTTLLLPSEY